MSETEWTSTKSESSDEGKGRSHLLLFRDLSFHETVAELECPTQNGHTVDA